MNKPIIPLLLAFTLPLAACGGAEVETIEPTTETPAPMDEGAATTEHDTVDVALTEYKISMPTSLPAGPTTFSITNEGSEEHNFEVEGQGIEQELDANLQPSSSATLDVMLQPGTYRVYCPVDDHAEAHGMELQLTVTPGGDSAADTTSR